ncbi:MAG: DUF4038 domain-containing protein [Bryobacteraceae bacterium]
MRLAGILLAAFALARAQPACAPTPAYSHCDLRFELDDAEAAAHPNPYATVQIHAEFRSPRHRTLLLPAFWAGARRMIIRFTPVEPGDWIYRVSGNIARFAGQTGAVKATASDSSGFVKAANVHHFSYTENFKPHLWMGDTSYRFAFLEPELFRRIVDARAAQKFNHLRGVIIGRPEDSAKIFPAPDRIDPAHFRALDERILYMNRKGIVADLVLAGDENHLALQFPTWQQRERYIRYVVARYAPLHVTWQGVQEFEEYENGRELMKEIGLLIKKYDPYQHPRSTHTVATSGPLLDDGWMDYIVYQSPEDALGAVEHQLFARPQVNAEFAYEDSGAGKSHPHHVDSDAFRRRLWNASMNGQYVTFGNTGTYGGRNFPVDAKYLDSPGAKQMGHWYDFFSRTRYWDLEPFFDVDGGRALALETIEYIVYVEKPGPVEVLVEKHSYDVAWFNPITGEYVKLKEWKGERFSGEPPTRAHDWVLHLSREGKKEGMLRSYKFESRRILLQEVESNSPKVPFEIESPAGDEISLAKPAEFSARIKRETRATRSMRWLWTVEVAADARGYRVAGAGPKGTLRIPRNLARSLPATMHLRLTGINANGKVYSTDRIFRLTP